MDSCCHRHQPACTPRAGAKTIPMEEYRRQQFDILADGVRGALDMDAVYAAMGMEKR